jgi:hypothetical protein
MGTKWQSSKSQEGEPGSQRKGPKAQNSQSSHSPCAAQFLALPCEPAPFPGVDDSFCLAKWGRMVGLYT